MTNVTCYLTDSQS